MSSQQEEGRTDAAQDPILLPLRLKNISEEVQGAEHWLSLENTPAGSGSQANTYIGDFPNILNGDDGAARWCIVFGRKVIDDGEDDADDADDGGEDDGVLF